MIAESQVCVVEPVECDEDSAGCDCAYHENVRAADASHRDTVEHAIDALDEWLEADSSREFKVRTNLLGHVATLFSGGNPVSVGRGRGSVNAIANSLENLK